MWNLIFNNKVTAKTVIKILFYLYSHGIKKDELNAWINEIWG